MDRAWPDRASEWSQADLHAYVRQMGINPDPSEIIPQGVKYIAWPQPPLTEAEIKRARELAELDSAGKTEAACRVSAKT